MKKGFTLIELLAVVILLSFLLMIVYPNVLEMFEKEESKIDQAKLDLIYSAAEQYINASDEIYHIGDKTCIKISDLDKENLIPIELEQNTLNKEVRVVIGKTNSYVVVDSCS